MFKKSGKSAKKAAASAIGKFTFGKSRKAPKQSTNFSVLQGLDEEDDGKGLQTEDEPGELNLSEEKEVAAPIGTDATKLNHQPDADESTGVDAVGGWSRVPPRQHTHQLGEPIHNTGHREAVVQSAAPWLNDNWRNPDKQANMSRFAAASTVKTARTKGTHTPGPRTRSGVLHANLKLGTITRRWDIRPCHNESIPDSDPRIVKQKDGSRCLKKGRYWLIVDCTAEQVWEIPLYTNNNTGLKYVQRSKWNEFLSIRPSHVSGGDFINQSPGNNVCAIDWLEDRQLRGKPMRTTMVAHFTEVFSRDINDEPVRVVGALRDEDIPIACEKARRYARR